MNALREFRRFTERFFICKGIVYFVRKLKNLNFCVPVMSLVGMIELVMIVHKEFEHLRRMKLWEFMKECVFHPYLLKV